MSHKGTSGRKPEFHFSKGKIKEKQYVKILGAWWNHGWKWLTYKELIGFCNDISPRTANERIKKMVEKQLLEKKGSSTHTLYRPKIWPRFDLNVITSLIDTNNDAQMLPLNPNTWLSFHNYPCITDFMKKKEFTQFQNGVGKIKEGLEILNNLREIHFDNIKFDKPLILTCSFIPNLFQNIREDENITYPVPTLYSYLQAEILLNRMFKLKKILKVKGKEGRATKSLKRQIENIDKDIEIEIFDNLRSIVNGLFLESLNRIEGMVYDIQKVNTLNKLKKFIQIHGDILDVIIFSLKFLRYEFDSDLWFELKKKIKNSKKYSKNKVDTTIIYITDYIIKYLSHLRLQWKMLQNSDIKWFMKNAKNIVLPAPTISFQDDILRYMKFQSFISQ